MGSSCSRTNIANEVVSTTGTARMAIERDTPLYRMNRKNRGFCVIFNHEHFFSSDNYRTGTNIDRDKLVKCFESMGFDVEVNQDFTVSQVLTRIEKLACHNHKGNDCVVVIVLTHGNDGFLQAKDAYYETDSLWKPFVRNDSNHLGGKPKMFFIQACRGKRLDPGVEMVDQTDGPKVPKSCKVAAWADFLIVHSTVHGYTSWRRPAKGTPFVEHLVNELNKSWRHCDLQKILTSMNRRIATEEFQDRKKQVAHIATTLLAELYFGDKIEGQAEDVKDS